MLGVHDYIFIAILFNILSLLLSMRTPMIKLDHLHREA